MNDSQAVCRHDFYIKNHWELSTMNGPIWNRPKWYSVWVLIVYLNIFGFERSGRITYNASECQHYDFDTLEAVNEINLRYEMHLTCHCTNKSKQFYRYQWSNMTTSISFFFVDSCRRSSCAHIALTHTIWYTFKQNIQILKGSRYIFLSSRLSASLRLKPIQWHIIVLYSKMGPNTQSTYRFSFFLLIQFLKVVSFYAFIYVSGSFVFIAFFWKMIATWSAGIFKKRYHASSYCCYFSRPFVRPNKRRQFFPISSTACVAIRKCDRPQYYTLNNNILFLGTKFSCLPKIVSFRILWIYDFHFINTIISSSIIDLDVFVFGADKVSAS